MARLTDYLYTADLVRRIQTGNETAFGELYLTTYPKIYQFCRQYLKNEETAKIALENTYTYAFKNIGQLREPTLVITWLYKIAFQCSYALNRTKSMINVDGKVYLIGNVLNLPFTESQVILMIYFMKMDIKTVCKQLGLQRNVVRRYLTLGKLHLEQLN